MRLSLDDVLWPTRYMMSTWGVWPIPPNVGLNVKYFAIFRSFLALTLITSLVVPQLYHIKIHWGNINILADTGCLVVVLSLIIFKFVYIISRRKSFCAIYYQLQEFWNVSDDDDERKSYEDFGSLAKLLTIVGAISGTGNFISFMAAALIPLAFGRFQANQTLRHRILPVDISYGPDTQKTPIFELLFICQTMGLFFVTTGAVGGDCTMMTIVLHVSGQLRFINTRFKTIGRKIDNNDEKSNLYVANDLAHCFVHHGLVVKVAKKVSDLMSPMVFGQMLTSGMEICLAGYAVIEGDNSGADLIKFCSFFVSMTVELFVWCWPSELLIQESNSIADAIYHHLPWYQLPTPQVKNLCFALFRAQKECHIATAFQVMSIQKLTEVFKAAGSYLTLLRTMRDK